MTRELDEDDASSIAAALEEMPETCALDVADQGGATSAKIGTLLGLRRDTVETLMTKASARVRTNKRYFESIDELLTEHPDDPYLKYSNMGADELADLTAELRARAKENKR